MIEYIHRQLSSNVNSLIINFIHINLLKVNANQAYIKHTCLYINSLLCLICIHCYQMAVIWPIHHKRVICNGSINQSINYI